MTPVVETTPVQTASPPLRVDGASMPSLVIGIFPFAPATQIDDLYGPLIREMSRQVGLPLRLRTASSFQQFSDNLAGGEYDIALVQPFDYPTLVDRGYRPIAKVSQQLRATLVARRETPVAAPGLAGVAGLRIGTPPETSAMRQLVNVSFVEAGLDPSELDMVAFATHADCLGQLQLDRVEVCAVGPVPLREFEDRTGETLVVLAVTEPVASIAFVAAPTVADEHVELIQRFLFGLDDDPEARTLLDRVGTTEYVPIDDNDYARICELMAMVSDQ